VCEREALLVCDQRELKRTSISYTLDTLKEIKQEQPQTRLFFIIGMDSLLSFTKWYHWQEILTLCHLVVNCRQSHPLENLSNDTQLLLKRHQLDKNIPPQLISKQAGYIIFAPQMAVNVSSTLIRNNIKEQQSCANLMPTSVLNYINEHKLYR